MLAVVLEATVKILEETLVVFALYLMEPYCCQHLVEPKQCWNVGFELDYKCWSTNPDSLELSDSLRNKLIGDYAYSYMLNYFQYKSH